MRFRKLRYWMAGKLVRLAEKLASTPAEYIYGPDNSCACDYNTSSAGSSNPVCTPDDPCGDQTCLLCLWPYEFDNDPND